jgi:hypothetical protein
MPLGVILSLTNYVEYLDKQRRSPMSIEALMLTCNL